MLNNWQELKEKVLKCTNCDLHKTRNNVVFGVGNSQAKVLFIGEAPGENEDLTGEPFVGRGGKLLDAMLSEIGLDRKNNIFIANMVKCRPPQNRDPKPSETAACSEYLKMQIELIDPKIIVCLGRVSATALIDKNFKVTKEHGKFIEKDGILMMGTFHPAALLRNPNNKPLAHEDFEKLRKMLLCM